jgi:hypothetical protein
MMEEIQIDSFKGIAPRYGKNLPVGYAETAENCLLYHGKLSPIAKNSQAKAETNQYNSFAYHCEDWHYGNDRFFCHWKINVLDLLLYKDGSNYLKKKVSWIITETDISFLDQWQLAAKTDISFDASSREIRSAASEFVVAEFPAGRKFTVAGSTSNNSTFTVSSLTAATTGVITVEEDVTDEAAGSSVTVTALKCIMSGAGDFNPDSLIEGGTFILSGSTSNNGTFTVSSTATNQWCICPDEAITDEAAGDTVTIKVCKEDYLGQTRQNAPTTSVGASTTEITGTWSEVAAQPNVTETWMGDLIEFDDKVYGGSAPNAMLWEWNALDAWIWRGTATGETQLRGMATLNNELYVTSYPSGKLWKWNGINVLNEVAPQLGAETLVRALINHNDVLYGGTGINGKLYAWNGINAWTEKAAKLGTETAINCLCVYNNKLYGGTGPNGYLYEWNDVDAWVAVSGSIGEPIRGIVEYNSKLYVTSGTTGKLYEWNDVDTLTEVAGQIESQTEMKTPVVWNSQLYCGSHPNAMLFRWNDSDSWVKVADQIGSEDSIHRLIVFDGNLFGATAEHAYFQQLVLDTAQYDIQYFITLTRNVGGHIDESGPGTVTDADTVVGGVEYQNITLTKPTWIGLGDDSYVTHWNIYRLSNATAAWQLLASVAWGTGSYIDTVADADLGDSCPSYYTSVQENEIIWDLPLKNLDGITTDPLSGMIFGWKGSRLYWNEPGYPDAWPDFYNLNFPAEIKNCVPKEPALAVLTTVGPMRVDGTNPETLQQSGICGPHPAMSVLGCCKTEYQEGGVLFLTDSGIAFFNMTTSRIITDEGFGEQWFKDNISSTGAVMIEVDNIIYLFHSGGGVLADFRNSPPIATTLSETIYGAYRKKDDDDLYVMDAAGIQKFGAATAGTKEMTWLSGELLGNHTEEKNFIETELMSESAEAVTVTNYVDGTQSSSASLSMDTVRDKRQGFLDEKAVGRAAQFKIYRAADDTLTPATLEINEAIVRYTR